MKRGIVKKSIAIIGEGETEWFYFDSLRIAHRYPFKLLPGLPSHPDIDHILVLAKKYLSENYDYVICLIDMDRINQIPGEFKKYQAEKKKKEFKDVWFIETHPCTEFWFLLHFLPGFSKRCYHSCDEILPELRKYMPGYEKTKRYFTKIGIYKYLQEHGNLENAKDFAKKLIELSISNPEDDISYSEIYKVIDLLDELK